ncbi:hypothetical protein ACLOJK_008239 [Asimina triloba]
MATGRRNPSLLADQHEIGSFQIQQLESAIRLASMATKSDSVDRRPKIQQSSNPSRQSLQSSIEKLVGHDHRKSSSFQFIWPTEAIIGRMGSDNSHSFANKRYLIQQSVADFPLKQGSDRWQLWRAQSSEINDHMGSN